MSVENKHNINNWHWTEKYFNEWAIPRIKELLTFEQNTDEFDVKVTADSATGDVFKYVRKNKLHESYDLKLKLSFKYNTPGSDIAEGSVAIEPFVDEEMDDWDFEVKVTNANKLPPELIASAKKNVSKTLFFPRIMTFLDEFKKME